MAVGCFLENIRCLFSKAAGLILVLIKKQLINLFDLDVEMNPLTLQVKLLFLVECLLNLLRGISSGYGL